MTSVDSARPAPAGVTQPWHDVRRPVAERVEALLAQLTVEEKLAQLGSRWLRGDLGGSDEPADTGQPAEPDGAHNVAPLQHVFAAGAGTSLQDAAQHGLGHLTRVYGSAPVSPAEGAAELVRQQRVVLAGTRAAIPAIVHEECLTGFTAFGATVYPTALAWGASFDPDLVEQMAAAIGRDMAALGVHQGLAPVLDVVRDYRWGRVEETMGEDPYLVATLGAAYVRGLQSAGVIATLKHFAGYSASRAARNHGPVSMGRRELLDVILPPFETAITAAGAGSVMNSYADIDGVPAAADPWLLTEILRERWQFAGTVVSDYWAVPFLATTHHVAADATAAGALALAAGIDVELPDTIGYGAGLARAVHAGTVPIEFVDRAARRVLTQKIELGLLDPQWTPESSVRDSACVDLDSPANRALARELAERSIVLLEAGTALPLLGEDRSALRRVAVVGPCADDARTLMGCYAFANHVLPRHPGHGLGIEVPTVLDALRTELGASEVVHEPGCAVLGEDRAGFAAAVAAARSADVCLAVVGDRAGLFGDGSSGEGCDVEDLRLPGVQDALLAELLATGTPVVVVVVSGRPYALGEVHERAAGLVQAFMPGEEGAAAVAGVLSGRVQPGGRLPVQIPRHPGGQPSTYLQPALGSEEGAGISSIDPRPLFAFGYGSSYTTFAFDDLQLSSTELPTDGQLEATVRVTNTGGRAGSEVVQLYLHDEVAQVARPVCQLIGFARVALEPGRSADVRFTVHADRTAYANAALERIVEPGDVQLWVGNSAANTPCRATVRLTGPVRVVTSGRQLLTPVDVVTRG
jgi:beta-xylosidase